MAGRCAASVRPSGPSSSSDWRAFFSKPPAFRCGSVTMTGADLLPASVLKRKAVVYVRQSTPAQVQFNLESQRQQYELVEVARRRGFHAIEIIDDDLGKSASGMVARPGFERLVGFFVAGAVWSRLGPGGSWVPCAPGMLEPCCAWMPLGSRAMDATGTICSNCAGSSKHA